MANKKDHKPYKRLDNKAKEFILEKMCQGMDIKEICTKYPDKVPVADNIYKAGAKGDEFSSRLTEAYGIMYMHRMDRMHEIAATPATDLYPLVSDWRLAEATKKSVLKEMEFSLLKLAPLFTKRFKQEPTIMSISTDNRPIVAINYFRPKEEIVVSNIEDTLSIDLAKPI